MAVDRHSATWRAVKAWADAELERIGRQNMVTGLGLAETEHLRGQYRALTTLMKLGETGRSAPAPIVGDD